MANVFYRRGIIETWGRGTLKIMDLLDKADLPAPEFISEAGHFTVTFRIPVDKRLTPQVTPHETPHVTPQDTMHETMHETMQVTPQVEQLLEICTIPLSRQEMQDKLQLRNRDHFRKNYLKPALEAGLIEQKLPHAPKSKLQKYRLTQAGSMYLQKLKKG